MGYKNRGSVKETPGKPMCYRLGCGKPQSKGVLCIKHNQEQVSLGQSMDEYLAKNCLMDKCRQTVKDRSAKKKAVRFGAKPKDDDDD